MNKIIHIAIAIDDSYTQHAGVMLTSLFENNKDNSIHIYVFSAALSNQNKEDIESVVKKYNQQFSFFTLRDDVFKNCMVSHYISEAAYYRIVIPRVIAENAELSGHLSLILYLDADMIILKDLSPLWKTDIHNKVLGAVRDPSFGHSKRLNFPHQYHYFNSGLLLINIEEWNRLDITGKILDYINRDSSNIVLHDQDALNTILYDKWQEISPIWNQQSTLFEVPYKILLKIYGKIGLDGALKSPAIVHYNNFSKPSHYLNIHPFKHLYFHYLKMTQWGNDIHPKVKLIDRVRKIYMFWNLAYKKINYYLAFYFSKSFYENDIR